MESVQFHSFGKVERNSRESGQKNQPEGDQFADIMEKSLEEVHTDKDSKEQKRDEKPEGIILPAQLLMFQNQTIVTEAAAMPGGEVLTAEQIQPLTVSVDVQSGVGQPETGVEGLLPNAEVQQQTAEENPAVGMTAGMEEVSGTVKAEDASEAFQLQKEGMMLDEEGTQVKTEAAKPAGQTKGHAAEIVSEEAPKETAAESMAVPQEEKDEQRQVTSVEETADRESGYEAIQTPGKTVQGKTEVRAQETVHVHVSQPEELPQELAKELAVKTAAGRNEFEIQITPKHLGEITVRIMQEDGVSVVSIICSEKKTMELLAQSAREIGGVMEQNLGKPTEIYVEKQESENLWQEQKENDHSGRESEQHRQREQNEKMRAAKNTRFLQELRLGLMN